ncbi:MAG: thioredoxin [Chthoniobacterales bacterium]|nr:thioredoxin [Chthoniobacterales bacterium]
MMEPDEQGLLLACPQCGQRNRLRYEGFGTTFRCGKCRSELSPPAVPIDLASERVFTALTTRSTLPVLVDFWAPWCGPCKMVAPEFTKVAAASAGRWIVAKVNTEQLPELASRFRINSIPTMVVLQRGTEIAREMGALPAARITQFLEQSIRR